MNKYTHLAVLDFEANCLRDRVIEPQEIIEVPVVVYDLVQQKIDRTKDFHFYCKPWTPITPFCTELTGITQKVVDEGTLFRDVLPKLGEWVWDNGWVQPNGAYTVLFVTCGDWDLATMLPKQCRYLGMDVPEYLTRWCNIKKLYKQFYKRRGGGMVAMLNELNIPLDGRHHSGIDDAWNTAKIAQRMHKDGCVFKVTNRP